MDGLSRRRCNQVLQFGRDCEVAEIARLLNSLVSTTCNRPCERVILIEINNHPAILLLS